MPLTRYRMSFYQEVDPYHDIVEEEGEITDFDEMDDNHGRDGAEIGLDDYEMLTRVTDASASHARMGKDNHGIPWDRLNLTREKYRLTRLEQYKNYENIPLSGEALEKIGTRPQEIIQLPSTIRKCQSIYELLFIVYPQLNESSIVTSSFLTERTILSPRNDDVSAVNNVALNIFSGEKFTYIAADKMLDEDEIDRTIINQYPTEYLNSLDPSGLPPFRLELKVGCPVMLLRNIAPKDGLCNGTRLIVVRCSTRVIECQILTGDKSGNLVFIPRIPLTPSSSDLPFKMTRRQFPIRLAFAVTINKSQGQSVKIVGVDLRTPVFSHGQLYVALSRCTNFDGLTILLPKDALNYTTNIVYPEDEVVPHLEPGMVPSTIDPDATGSGERANKAPKRPVRISAWKLAKLDSNEAMRAAAKARESSSVLRPLDNLRITDPELSSSGNMSVRSSISADTGGNKDTKNELATKLSAMRNSFAPSQGNRDEYESATPSVSSFSSPSHNHESVTLSPLPKNHGFGRFSAASSTSIVPGLVQDREPQISSGFDEKIMRKTNSTDPRGTIFVSH